MYSQIYYQFILTFSFRALNGAWPSIISNTKHPKLNQSVLYVYFSLSITSGARTEKAKYKLTNLMKKIKI